MMIKYITGSLDFIDKIKNMWNKQRIFHSQCSTHFGDDFARLTYNQRKRSFYEDGKQLFIVIAKENDKDIGYCVASIIQNKGEIESIYVNENYRSQKVGSTLMDKSLKWFIENGIEKIEIYVAVGNESAYNFYEQFGFLPRLTKLERKSNN